MEVERLLKAGIIPPSSYAYAALCLTVSKNSGSRRLVIDRAINKLIRPCSYNLLRIYDILYCLANAYYVTSGIYKQYSHTWKDAAAPQKVIVDRLQPNLS